MIPLQAQSEQIFLLAQQGKHARAHVGVSDLSVSSKVENAGKR